ncbi:MAG: peptidoglycan DD-metalloendopeptidase family protein [Thermoleophilaceae bacterium]
MQRRQSIHTRGLWAFSLAVCFATGLAAAPAGAAEPWTWPVRGEVLTSYRNGADPYAAGQHRGIDIAAAPGTAVVAAAAGTVTFAGGAGTSGLTVAVRTADGRFDTSYLHLSSLEVRAGDAVAAGARLGSVGVTGRRSLVAAHLHFGVREAGSRHAYRDPLEFLGSPPGPAPPPGAPLVAPLRAGPRATTAAPPALAPFPALAARPVPTMQAAPRSPPRFVPGRLPRIIPAPGRDALGRARVDAGEPVAAPVLPRNVPAEPSRAPGARPEGPGPDLGVAPAGATETGPAPAPEGDRRPSAAPRPDGGLDVGRLLALAGLLAAAALAARPAERRAVAEHGRLALGALLRPLAGRR